MSCRNALRVALAALVTMVTVLLGSAPAWAHSVLESSDPADGATLTVAPSTITLTFNETVQNFQPKLVVTGPNGNNFVTGDVETLGAKVSAAIDGNGPAGEYTIAYRIVSADGHPVSGKLHYTLAASAAGEATGTPVTAQDSALSEATGARAGLPVWLWIGIAIAMIVLVVAGWIFFTRPAED